MDRGKFETGLDARRRVLGDEYVDRAFGTADAFNFQVQQIVTEACWARSGGAARSPITGTYDTGFHTRLMAKDVRLFNSVADEAGTGHSVSNAVGALWDDCERAMPASDFSEIWTFVAGDRA